MEKSLAARRVGGVVAAPASKSSMQRAVACAMLAAGRSRLLRPSLSADSLAALGLAEAFGARREIRDGIVIIDGPVDLGRRGGLSVRCGESGLLMRMASAIASLVPATTVLEASGSLARRPVSMVVDPLVALGASCGTSGGLPPVVVRGPITGGRATVDGRESSQFLTGLLIALALAPQDSLVEVEGLASRGYVDLTVDTMRAFGAEVLVEGGHSRFSLRGGQSYACRDFAVEGDWSGAAFLLVAGAIAGARGGPGLVVSGLDRASSQPDRAILAALEAAGATLAVDSGQEAAGSGPDAGLAVRAEEGLRPFSFDARDCPDLFPPLVALAAASGGVSRIAGVGRLRHKESDRAAALVEGFGALGIEVRVEGDELAVTGGRVGGGRVDSRGDHRIAMAAAIASLVASERVVIGGAECVAKSWPSFFEDLDSVAG